MATYLTEDLPVYQCAECLCVGEAETWIDDDYEGLVCGECGVAVKHSHDTKASWWSIGVYSTGRSYGGPEEGGWWYDTGSITDQWKVRGFDNFTEAQKYAAQLREEYKDERDVAVRGFTEQLPVAGYPDRRPVYC